MSQIKYLLQHRKNKMASIKTLVTLSFSKNI